MSASRHNGRVYSSKDMVCPGGCGQVGVFHIACGPPDLGPLPWRHRPRAALRLLFRGDDR